MRTSLFFAVLFVFLIGCDNMKANNSKEDRTQEAEKKESKITPEEEDLQWTKSQKASAIKDCIGSEEKNGGADYSEETAKELCSCRVAILSANLPHDEYKEIMESGGETEDKAVIAKFSKIRKKMNGCDPEEKEED